MKKWQKIVWNVSLTIVAFLIIYSLFVMILGGFFVVFQVKYESFLIFLLYATIFFTIRFVTDELFNQLSIKATQHVRKVGTAVIAQIFISAILHFVIIFCLGWMIRGIVVPLYIQVILAFGCSFVEVVLNGKWKTFDNKPKS